MSRLVLVGAGPLPAPGARTLSFAQHRTAHFLAALQAAGHDTRLHLTAAPAADLLHKAEGADALITAGPHGPALRALEAALPLPLWIDRPGDPFAELDALLRRGPLAEDRLASALAAAHGPLLRADALSPISQRQALATHGQLAAIGRLGADVPQVAPIPIAALRDWPAQDPRPAGATFTIALSGAFNAWFDEETAIAGLERALAAQPRLRVIATGGGLPGFFEEGGRRFAAFADRHPDKVRHLGWIDHAALPAALAPAQVGLCLDRPGLEPLLGSRTRALLFARLGLGLVANARTELVADLAAAHPGAVFTPPPGDPAALAALLLELVDRPPAADAIRALQADVDARFDPTRIAAPLLAWAAAPQSAPRIHSDPRGVLTAENERLRSAIAAIEASPTWRILNRAHKAARSLKKRMGAAHTP